MRKPKRYELAVDGHDMLESNYGEYVAHSDYLVLLESYEELVAALNKHGRHESLCKIRSGAIGAQCSCVIGKAIKQVQP